MEKSRSKGKIDQSSKPVVKSVSPGASGDAKVVINEKEKKKQAFITRSIWTFVMLIFFLLIISSGHFTLISFVVLFQILTFKEIIQLVSEPAKDKNIALNKFINWYFLFTTIYYLDGKTLFEFFHEELFQNKLMSLLSVNHKFISYFLYVFGFMIFILNLKKDTTNFNLVLYVLLI